MKVKFLNQKGFTLVELIVVLAVLAVISAIAVPRFLEVQETAKLDSDYATGAMLSKAAELYLADDSHKDTDLDGKTAVELQGLLKTTAIKFTSKDFIGKEGTLDFTEGADGLITVTAKKIDDTVATLYPR